MGKGIREQMENSNHGPYKPWHTKQLEAMLNEIDVAKKGLEDAIDEYTWEIQGRIIKHPRRSKDFIGKKR